MYRSLIVSGLCFLLTASSVLGSPVISIGTHNISNTNQEYRIPIMVSSATHERVEGVILVAQIGDGGTVNGGSNTSPRITDLDIIGSGTIFNASNTGCTPQYLGEGGNPPYLIAMAETTTTISGDLEANGVLAWLTVNSLGAALGSYRIDLQNVAANVTGGPWTTDFAGIPASFPANDGWIVIVPEPSIVVLLLAAIGMCFYKRQFRRPSE